MKILNSQNYLNLQYIKMKNRLVEIKKKSDPGFFLFDRTLLIKGIRNKQKIPNGGIIVNNQLGGFMQTKNGLKWSKIGEIRNHQHIMSGGGNQLDNQKDDDNVSLKTAVKILRDYYKNNFN